MQIEERRLAAIVVGDIVGYSAMIGRNEADTLAKVFAFQSQLLEPTVAEHGGRVVKTTGDGFLAEFSSVVNAVRCAIAVQVGLGEWPDVGDPLSLRIGVHLGDVVVRDGDIYGDGVNIAARLEQAAEPGGILVSSTIWDQMAGHDVARFSEAGAMELKNIDRPIHTWRWQPDDQTEPVWPVRPSTKPSIAVLPFDDLSGEPEQAYLADGVVQDLITLLSRFHWFRVIARASTFALAGQSLSAKDLGGRLNARYLLQGSVRRAGNRIRLTAELVDSSSGTQVWAERFDRTFDDVFELQDDIVRGIVGAVVPHFVVTSGAPEVRTSPSSWELSMRGWNLAWRLDGSEATMLEARALFEQAIEADPGNGLAYSGLAFTSGNPFYLAGLTRDADRALQLAHRAVEIDPHDAFAWCLVGAAEMWNGSLDDAERHVKRSISLNPSLALAFMYMASLRCWRSDVDGADSWARLAEELSPADPMLPFAAMSRSMARFGAGLYGEALKIANEVIEIAPELPSAWRIRAASLEMLGRHHEAADAVARVLTIQPFTLDWARENLTPFSDADRWEIYLSALGRAGVSEARGLV